jgi:mannose-1-phosphate guanylyltransferase
MQICINFQERAVVGPVLVIMAGGRGERFWPRSRRNHPKQLLTFTGSQSLLQDSVARIRELTCEERIYVVTNIAQAAAVKEQLPFLPARNILIEPQGRNTAPCVGLAAAYIQKHYPDENPVIAFLPSDSMVFNPAEMRRVLTAGFQICKENESGVIFGMWPARPDTGFGYIQLGKKLGVCGGVPYHRVAAFKEKPDQATAEKYLAAGEYLWNGGIFIWQLTKLWSELRESLPELYQGLELFLPSIGQSDEISRLSEIYAILPAISADCGILEKTTGLVVVPTDYGWDDLGSWSAYERLLAKDGSGNVVYGRHIGVATRNCIIHSPLKTVTTLGVSDLIIVDTGDVLLVCAKEQAQNIKELLRKINDAGRQDLL